MSDRHAIAIVRGLAEQNPIQTRRAPHRMSMSRCRFCNSGEYREGDPVLHDDGCLWYLASTWCAMFPENAPHVVTIEDDGWTIDHPLECRNLDVPLTRCPTVLAWRKMLADDGDDSFPDTDGRWEIFLSADNTITFGKER